MKLRIAIWAALGALVVVFWTLYLSDKSPAPLGFSWTLVYVTCPIALFGNHALSIYSVLVANAGTYALVGMAVEGLRWRLNHRQPGRISS